MEKQEISLDTEINHWSWAWKLVLTSKKFSATKTLRLLSGQYIFGQHLSSLLHPKFSAKECLHVCASFLQHLYSCPSFRAERYFYIILHVVPQTLLQISDRLSLLDLRRTSTAKRKGWFRIRVDVDITVVGTFLNHIHVLNQLFYSESVHMTSRNSPGPTYNHR